MKQSLQFNRHTITLKAGTYARIIHPYTFVLFLLFISLLYGLIMMRINTLSSLQPTDAAVTSQVESTRLPVIEDDIIKQLESLRDNSVNVKALFTEIRNNPFSQPEQ